MGMAETEGLPKSAALNNLRCLTGRSSNIDRKRHFPELSIRSDRPPAPETRSPAALAGANGADLDSAEQGISETFDDTFSPLDLQVSRIVERLGLQLCRARLVAALAYGEGAR
jgi:hypothetical protein